MREEDGGDERGRTAPPPSLPSDLDRPRFFQHEGSPAPTLSLHRRTVPAPRRIPGPLTGGRKAAEEQGEIDNKEAEGKKKIELLSPGKVGTITSWKVFRHVQVQT